MNYTGTTVSSLRRGDILDGVQAWLNSRISTNQMLTGRLHNAKIVAYKFEAGKNADGESWLWLAVRTQLGDVEVAAVKWDVTIYGTLYAAVFSEVELVDWCYNVPLKILHALTPTKNKDMQAWRVEAIADAAERAAVKAQLRTLHKIFKA